MNPKPKVFIDFDDTLFDRSRFTQEYYRLMVGLTGATLDEVREAYHHPEVYSKGFHGPRKHLQKMAEAHDFDMEEAANQMEKLLEDTSEYVFPEAQNFLASMSGKFDLILMTVGERSFQESKVKNSGLVNYFSEQIYINPDEYKAIHIKNHLQKGEQFYLIDDKKAELDALNEVFGDKTAADSCILVQGGNYLPVYDRLLANDYVEENFATT